MTADPILIFGGSGGIGEALARRLRTEGRNVFITSRSRERAQKLAAEIGAIALYCDVLDEASRDGSTISDGAMSGISA